MIRMGLMEYRLKNIQGALEALRETGVDLLGKSSDGLYGVAGLGDDPGIYYFVPRLAHATGWDLQTAINVFILSLIGISLVAWGVSFLRPRSHPLTLLAAILGMGVLARWAYLFSDVYVAQLTAVLTVIPFFLRRDDNRLPGAWLWVGTFLAGILWGVLEQIRSGTGWGGLVFITLWALTRRSWAFPRRAGLILAVLAGMAIPSAHFHHLESRRDAWLAQRQPATTVKLDRGHSFWHSVYIGFGYLKNPYGLEYLDRYAYERAARVDPTVTHFTPRYHDILRDAVFELARRDPWFVLKTLAAKFALLFGWFALFSATGWWVFPWARPKARELIPPLGAAFYFALPGLLVYPQNNYVFGMIALAVVLGPLWLEAGLRQGEPKPLWARLKGFGIRPGNPGRG